MNNPFNSDFLKQRWSEGAKIGLFDNFYKLGSGQPAQAPDFINQITSTDAYKKASEGERNTMLTAGIIQSLNKPQYSIEELEGLREREARRAQEIGKESLRETMKAKMFYDLPGNVAKAFSGPASIYYAGMSQVPSVYNQAVQAFRPLSLTSTSVVTPGAVPSYFS